MTPLITRIAPSPTGMFHFGTARTAYFNYLAAKASGGKFILRIDDTDVARNDEAHVGTIMDALSWLGLTPDDTFRQSDRLDEYRRIADALVDANKAVRLDDGAITLELPDNMPDTWRDYLGRKDVKINDHDRKFIDGLVLMRSTANGGGPTYNFASIVDDMFAGVNLVIRGVDHIANTSKQVAVKAAIEGNAVFSPPRSIEFAHVGLIEIIGEDGKRAKLSKRSNAHVADIMSFKADGYSAEAVLAYMLRMNWNPSDANFDKHNPPITTDRAIGMFLTEGRLKNSAPLFERKQLDAVARRLVRMA
jgi:glutamyl-tRNA synthetase